MRKTAVVSHVAFGGALKNVRICTYLHAFLSMFKMQVLARINFLGGAGGVDPL